MELQFSLICLHISKCSGNKGNLRIYLDLNISKCFVAHIGASRIKHCTTVGKLGFLSQTNEITYSFVNWYYTIDTTISDRFKVTQNKINFNKNCPQWGLNLQIMTPMLWQLSWAGICWPGDFWSELCFMHHFTCWTLFITRINRAWLYKDLEDSGWQLNVDLAQLSEHWSHDLEVVSFYPTGGNFWRNLFCSVIWQKHLLKNSNRTVQCTVTCLSVFLGPQSFTNAYNLKRDSIVFGSRQFTAGNGMSVETVTSDNGFIYLTPFANVTSLELNTGLTAADLEARFSNMYSCCQNQLQQTDPRKTGRISLKAILIHRAHV